MDKYYGKVIKCPHCGHEYRKSLGYCPECKTQLFFTTEDNDIVFCDPAVLDRSKKYKVHGLLNNLIKTGECTEYYPGDYVELINAKNRPFMTDCSVSFYVDGNYDVEGFMMPPKDIAITTVTRGMAMNSTEYHGPYGERLSCPVYKPENILKPGEPTPQSNSMMGMGMMGMSMMMQMQMQTQAVPNVVSPSVVPEWTCECGKVCTTKFCPECGMPMKNV